MRISCVDGLVAGTALSLALALTGPMASAQSNTTTSAQAESPDIDAKLNAAIPAPEAPQLPPMTADDFTSERAAPVTATIPQEPAKPAASNTAPAKVETSESAKPADSAAAKPAEQNTAATPTNPAVTAPAVTTTASPAPLAAPSAIADSAITDKVREAVTGKLERVISRKNERSAAEAFYKERNYAPLWITDGAINARGKAAVDYLAHVDRDGLEPSDYPTPNFAAATSADALADDEVKLTAAVLAYARHAANGRVNYTRVSGDIYYNHPVLEPAEALSKLAASTDVAVTLDSFEPQQPQYKALKKALADARAGKTEPEKKAEKKPVVHIGAGKILRPGMKDERVIALRKRLDIAGDKTNTAYDDAVFEAVKKFQKESQLGTDGMLGPNTVRALNGEEPARAKLGDPVDTIIVNMDRWRWMPRNLGNPYVVVNIPDYRLTLMKDGKPYWSTKIVVGLPSKPTPIISAEMKYITVNPTWNVPPSIIQNEYLPALQEDPTALDRIGLKVEQAPDGTVRIYQPPGAANALGRIRFNFPNKFLVYQHDTPDKYLFARDKRAYSHGCMRVQDPLVYGEKLLSLVLPEEHYTAARLEKMFGGSEINISFPASKYVPVHLTYQTAFVDQDGKLQLREDVYGRDARMIAQLKGSERKVADIPMERPPNTSAKPVRLAPGSLGGPVAGGGGPNFFEWLFGPPRFSPPQQRARRDGRYSSRDNWR